MFPRKACVASALYFFPPPLSSFPPLLSSFSLWLLLPVAQLLPLTVRPLFSNRRLEINSTLVWPETLMKLNMNDWDCSSTCCWDRCMMALGDFFFIPLSSKQPGHFVLFLQLTGSLGYLFFFLGDQCAALWTLIGFVWGCHFCPLRWTMTILIA